MQRDSKKTRDRKYQFGGLEFAIREVSNVAREMERLGYSTSRGEQLEGAWLPNDSLIVIRSGQSQKRKASTILHEMLHACGISSEAKTLKLEQMLVPVLLSQGWSPLSSKRKP